MFLLIWDFENHDTCLTSDHVGAVDLNADNTFLYRDVRVFELGGITSIVELLPLSSKRICVLHEQAFLLHKLLLLLLLLLFLLLNLLLLLSHLITPRLLHSLRSLLLLLLLTLRKPLLDLHFLSLKLLLLLLKPLQLPFLLLHQPIPLLFDIFPLAGLILLFFVATFALLIVGPLLATADMSIALLNCVDLVLDPTEGLVLKCLVFLVGLVAQVVLELFLLVFDGELVFCVSESFFHECWFLMI